MTSQITFAIVLLALPALAVAEHPARMRYEEALRVANLVVTDLEGVKSQTICFSIRSSLTDILPSDIRITLQTGAGDVALPIDLDGRFTLPVTEALRAENPWLVANQPKGSMIMSASVEVEMRVSPEWQGGLWKVRYSSLFPIHNVLKRVGDVTDAISRTHRVTSTFPLPKSVTLTCDDELANAKLIIGRESREICSPVKGEFVILFDAALMSADSWITIDPPRGWSFTPEFESAVSEIKKAEASD